MDLLKGSWGPQEPSDPPHSDNSGWCKNTVEGYAACNLLLNNRCRKHSLQRICLKKREREIRVNSADSCNPVSLLFTLSFAFLSVEDSAVLGPRCGLACDMQMDSTSCCHPVWGLYRWAVNTLCVRNRDLVCLGLITWVSFLILLHIFNEGKARIGEKVEKDDKIRFIWAFSLGVYTLSVFLEWELQKNQAFFFKFNI